MTKDDIWYYTILHHAILSSMRRWWTRLTPSIVVDCDDCIIQFGIIYTVLYHDVRACSNYTEQYKQHIRGHGSTITPRLTQIQHSI